MSNALNWFEIPATDIERAVTFYGKILDTELVVQESMPVLTPKTDIGENGFMAYFQDSEGNKVGLHSMS
jgi:predicted enzyme related to lactoylglutathione lyase